MGEGFSVLQGTKTQSSLYSFQSSIRRVRSWAEQAAEAGEAGASPAEAGVSAVFPEEDAVPVVFPGEAGDVPVAFPAGAGADPLAAIPQIGRAHV